MSPQDQRFPFENLRLQTNLQIVGNNDIINNIVGGVGCKFLPEKGVFWCR